VRAALSLTQPLSRSRRAGDCAPYLVTFLLLFAWQKVCAQLAPAKDFFNGGAQFYISNNIPGALEVVTNGLQRFPDDTKLKKLYELLHQQNQQQQQQNQQQSQNNQQSQSDQKQPDQKDQSKQNPQDQKQQPSKLDPQPPKNQPAQDQQGQKGQPDQRQNGGQERASAPTAGQMTPQEAQRLLDAQKGDEKVLQFKPDGKANNSDRPIKDW
jgi:hypothetical protein